MNFHTKCLVNYRLAVIDAASGLVVRELPQKRNLVLDSGINSLLGKVSGFDIGSLTKVLVIGSGNMPTKRDSGAVTFIRSGTTITASAGFFEANDVGRLLRWDTGEEVYITGYTSSAVVSCANGPDIASGQGTVWYVNRTSLQTSVENTSTITGVGNTAFNGTVDISPSRRTLRRSLITPARATPVTITEVGWGNWNGGSFNYFGVDTLAAPVALSVGQQLRATIDLVLSYPALDQLVSVPNFAKGCDSSGTLAFDGNPSDFGLGWINTDGTSTGSYQFLQPALDVRAYIAPINFVQYPGSASDSPEVAGRIGDSSRVFEPYSVFGKRTLRSIWAPGVHVGPVYGVYWSFSGRRMSVKFNTPFNLTVDQRLTVDFTWTISRTLQN